MQDTQNQRIYILEITYVTNVKWCKYGKISLTDLLLACLICTTMFFVRKKLKKKKHDYWQIRFSDGDGSACLSVMMKGSVHPKRETVETLDSLSGCEWVWQNCCTTLLLFSSVETFTEKANCNCQIPQDFMGKCQTVGNLVNGKDGCRWVSKSNLLPPLSEL